MKNFHCQCGHTVFFENTQCLNCGRALGFLPDQGVLSALEPAGDERWRALVPEGRGTYFRQCRNYRDENVCNWMIPEGDSQTYCRSCRLNHMIPDLSLPKNRTLWARIETAKRRLLYTLFALGLPAIGRQEQPERGLAFEFLADLGPGPEFADDLGHHRHVITGHRDGLITINIAEADAAVREEMREKMHEMYRTLLGHFRHESGHYYWNRLVRDGPWHAEFRVLFGDEQQEYDEALRRYYESGPPAGWQHSYISAYATAHPWEDWAETWAHYLHIVDTLETAHDYGFFISGRQVRPPATRSRSSKQRASGRYQTPASIDDLLGDWARLAVALNALNRSLGLSDAYPFVLSPAAAEKLRFVHRVIGAAERV